MVSTLRLGYMAGVSIHRHSTTLCGDTLTTHGTTGTGICVTTLITGVLAIVVVTIRTIMDITTHTTALHIHRSIVLTTSQVEVISILQTSVVTLRLAIPRLHRAITRLHRAIAVAAEQAQLLELVVQHLRA